MHVLILLQALAKHKLFNENKKEKKNKKNMNYLISCPDYFIGRHEEINIIKRTNLKLKQF